jgi:hypothetical protein
MVCAPATFGSGGSAHTTTWPDWCPVAKILPLGPTQQAQVAGPAPCGTHAGASAAAAVGECAALGEAGSASAGGTCGGLPSSSGSLGASASSFCALKRHKPSVSEIESTATGRSPRNQVGVWTFLYWQTLQDRAEKFGFRLFAKTQIWNQNVIQGPVSMCCTCVGTDAGQEWPPEVPD